MSNLGHSVQIVDIDEKKITRWQQKDYPIFEQGLDEYYEIALRNGLTFSTVPDTDSDFYFVAVGTPKQLTSNDADLTFVRDALENITNIASKRAIIIMKSTVPIGSNTNFQRFLNTKNTKLSLVSNPEFLREGSAFQDFFKPDRLVFGGENIDTISKVADLYRGLENQSMMRNQPEIISTNFESAELIKHASNGFLATKLSYINEIAQLSKVCNADAHDVIKGIGADPRIGTNFLQPGPGWGGSCFPKDSAELCSTSNSYGVSLKVLSAAVLSNTNRKEWCAEQAVNTLRRYNAKTVGVFGVAFKANTDDVRDSSAFTIVESLESSGYKVVITDEKAVPNFKSLYGHHIQAEALSNIFEKIDSAVILTEWSVYSGINWKNLIQEKNLKCVIDFRNITKTYNDERIQRY
jgi:UDPglucose 6-dehydrogenase